MGLHLAVLVAAAGGGAADAGGAAGGSGGGIEQLLDGGVGLVLGGGGTLTIVGSAIWYIIKFQRTFTTKLEESDKAKEKRIRNLERRLNAAEASERRCQYRLAAMGRLLVEHDIPWEEPSIPWEGATTVDETETDTDTPEAAP